MPGYIYSYLEVLKEVALGAAAEASNLSRKTAAAVESIKQEAAIWEQQHGRADEVSGDGKAGTAGIVGGAGSNGKDGKEEDHSAVGEGTAWDFFMDRMRAKQEGAGLSGVDLDKERDEIRGHGPTATSFSMAPWERAEADERLRQVHAVALLATSALDAAVPLIPSKVLRVSGLASGRVFQRLQTDCRVQINE